MRLWWPAGCVFSWCDRWRCWFTETGFCARRAVFCLAFAGLAAGVWRRGCHCARQDEPLGLGVVQQRQAKKRYGAAKARLEAVMGLVVARLGVGLAFTYQADECGHGAGRV